MTDQETEDTDQYDSLLRAMESGLLVSVNNEVDFEPGTQELEVERSDEDDTYVVCKAGFEEWKVIHRNRNNELVVSDMDDEIGLRYDVDVISIEVLGIA